MTPKITKPQVQTLDLIKIRCPECKRHFKSKNALNVHLAKSHNVSYKIDLDSQGLVYLRTTIQTMVG